MIKKDLSLYIHIPFCEKKCAYCDFLSGPASQEEKSYYVRTLLREIRTFEPIKTLYKVRTIFFGGGTPSTLSPQLFTQILELIKNTFEVAPDAEISVECNPGTLSEEKLRCYRDLGVNRLSLGLQSANDHELKLLGRIHNFEQFRNNYALARRMGFDNINVDLMSGIPTQTMESFKYSLDKVLELGPEHISVYSLILEEGTPFYEYYTTIEGSRLLPSEETEREMYHFTKDYLASYGYERYEISNYAKPGKECKHNLVYWRLGQYLGFGYGAASCLDGRRFTNPKESMEDYWDYARRAYTEYKLLSPNPEKEAMEEFMFLGLRTTRGITKKDFYDRFVVPYDEVYGGVTDRLLETGLLLADGDRLYLSERGIDVSNRVMASFLISQ